MKEYNIIEVLNSPVGTKFRDKNVEVEKIDIVFTVVENNNSKYLEDDVTEGFVPLNNHIINTIFVKEQSPLTFFEAMETIKNGKKVYSEKHEDIIFYKDDNGELCREYINNKGLFSDKGIIINNVITIEELNGKWYEYEEQQVSYF